MPPGSFERRRISVPELTESGIQQIVDNTLKEYERDVAKPAREEIGEQLRDLAGGMAALNTTMTKIDGGVTAIKWLLRGAALAAPAIWAVLQIVRTMRGHG